VMLNAGLVFCREEVAPGCLEELQHRLILE
jgi:hypothetical protein